MTAVTTGIKNSICDVLEQDRQNTVSIDEEIQQRDNMKRIIICVKLKIGLQGGTVA